MLGAIIGDIVGSVYEWHNIKTKAFPLFRADCRFTDAIFMCRYYFGGYSGDYETPINDDPEECKKRIKRHIESEYGYDLSHTLDEIRPGYSFDVSCQGSVPEAIIAFLESTEFSKTAICLPHG